MIVDVICYNKNFFDEIKRNVKTLIFRDFIDMKDQIVL